MSITVKPAGEVRPADLGSEQDVQGVELLPLITEKDGAARFSLRLIRVAPGGYTPLHEHPWEHEVYVTRGFGQVESPAGSQPLDPGAAVFVPAGDRHRFRAGREGMDFVCCIPNVKPE